MVVATRPQNRRSHINPRGIGVVLRDRAQLIRGFRAHQRLITKGDIDDSRPFIGRFFGRIGRVVAIGRGGSLSSPEKNRSGEGEAQSGQQEIQHDKSPVTATWKRRSKSVRSIQL